MGDVKVYMIRRRKDGLYSSGGSYPYFNKTGKMWPTIGRVRQHLSSYYHNCMIRKNGKNVGFDVSKWADNHYNAYLDCDVVEAEISFQTYDDVFRVVANKFVEMQDKEEKKKARKPRKTSSKKKVQIFLLLDRCLLFYMDVLRSFTVLYVAALLNFTLQAISVEV